MGPVQLLAGQVKIKTNQILTLASTTKSLLLSPDQNCQKDGCLFGDIKALKDGCDENVLRDDTNPCWALFFLTPPGCMQSYSSLISQWTAKAPGTIITFPRCISAPLPRCPPMMAFMTEDIRRSTSRTIESIEDVLACINACSNTVPSQSY